MRTNNDTLIPKATYKLGDSSAGSEVTYKVCFLSDFWIDFWMFIGINIWDVQWITLSKDDIDLKNDVCVFVFDLVIGLKITAIFHTIAAIWHNEFYKA